jgi:hypothetical protein
MQHAGRKNEKIPGMGVKPFILDQNLRMPLKEKIKFIMGMHMKGGDTPVSVQRMPTAKFGAVPDIIGFRPDDFFQGHGLALLPEKAVQTTAFYRNFHNNSSNFINCFACTRHVE